MDREDLYCNSESESLKAKEKRAGGIRVGSSAEHLVQQAIYPPDWLVITPDGIDFEASRILFLNSEEGRNEKPLATLANLRLQGNMASFKIDDLCTVQTDADNVMGSVNSRPDETNGARPANIFGVFN